jgi:Uma2 family endonuclease
MALSVLKEKVWTYDDYCRIPDDLNTYEIIEGELFMTPAPTTKHQRTSRNLFVIMHTHIVENNLGELLYAPLDVLLSNINVFQPDIIFISKENKEVLTEKNIQGIPDLAIEILSPDTARKDRINKMRVYAKFKVPHIWLLNPDNQTLEAFEIDNKTTYRLVAAHQEDEKFRPSLFEGLIIPLKEVWG